MYDENAHHLLAQVALTVSPFVSLPSATTLPYTYKALPSGLPQSSTADRSGLGDASRPAFVTSSTGQAANPQDMQASCQKLQAHLKQLRDESGKSFDEWEQSIRERELAEKRRVAPGWLDRKEKILQPERAPASSASERQPPRPQQLEEASKQVASRDTPEGEELDRAFGSLGMR